MSYALSLCQVLLQPDLQIRQIRMNGIPQNLEVDLIVSMNNPVSHANDRPEIGNGFAQGVIQFSRFIQCLSNDSELEKTAACAMALTKKSSSDREPMKLLIEAMASSASSRRSFAVFATL